MNYPGTAVIYMHAMKGYLLEKNCQSRTNQIMTRNKHRERSDV
jgi:hypothetical protein